MRVRTNYRDEDVLLYRIDVAPADARRLFEVYLQRINQLADQPEFYHLLSNSCTINIIRYANAAGRVGGYDIRHSLNGLIDGYLYASGGIKSTLPLPSCGSAPGSTTLRRVPATRKTSRSGFARLYHPTVNKHGPSHFGLTYFTRSGKTPAATSSNTGFHVSNDDFAVANLAQALACRDPHPQRQQLARDAVCSLDFALHERALRRTRRGP